MRLKVHWTGKSKDHIARHRIRKEEVDASLEGDVYWRAKRGRMTVIGCHEGRYLFIVLKGARARPGFCEVVTARPATRSEKRLFARRGKRK